MQLVAYGAQDIYLTGNPQITFFKVVYRRHTNFAMESIKQSATGTAKVGTSSNEATFTISRTGDLVHRMYAVIGANGNNDEINAGAALLQEVSVEIGGQQIDKHYAQWLEIWAELTEPNPTGAIDTTLFQKMSCMGGVTTGLVLSGDEVSVPLQFWFNRNPGLALPLIALQYHEVKVVMKIGSQSGVVGSIADSGGTTEVQLWADYIYLDTDERRRFAQVSHEYLIEQLQHNSLSATNTTLTFNHPVKELVWCQGDKYDVSGQTLNTDTTYQLKLNGQDRFAARTRNYFTRAQVWQHHTGFGGISSPDSIAVYSFALKPEEHQPSGTCNFSRIDNAQLITTGSGLDGSVYAVNYNVLRIMSGMGGLAYSN